MNHVNLPGSSKVNFKGIFIDVHFLKAFFVVSMMHVLWIFAMTMAQVAQVFGSCWHPLAGELGPW